MIYREGAKTLEFSVITVESWWCGHESKSQDKCREPNRSIVWTGFQTYTAGSLRVLLFLIGQWISMCFPLKRPDILLASLTYDSQEAIEKSREGFHWLNSSCFLGSCTWGTTHWKHTKEDLKSNFFYRFTEEASICLSVYQVWGFHSEPQLVWIKMWDQKPGSHISIVNLTLSQQKKLQNLPKKKQNLFATNVMRWIYSHLRASLAAVMALVCLTLPSGVHFVPLKKKKVNK